MFGNGSAYVLSQTLVDLFFLGKFQHMELGANSTLSVLLHI
jgi:hypothetical protein